jgi:hypothetical protein
MIKCIYYIFLGGIIVIILVLLILAFDFFISYSNASYCGRYWSESKATGGSFRAYVVCGYVMAIAGFTMVYGYIVIMLLPYILPLFPKFADTDMTALIELSSDLLYVMIAVAVIPTGFIIWFRSVANAWKQRSFGNIVTAGWNTYAQVHNTVSACREMPNALRRIAKSLFGGKKKKGSEYIVALAILVIIIALLGGYFTASAIMKKADAEYDELPQNDNYY